ncbi:hypothetical protein PSHT_08895 [Puccinia striiformis]|uniref:Uncharacterized protein n=1 Tax=Puccinia striiformis TaxID=27350 RepID=A0A2S4VK90_9BASI|nr:hypothetical protein PSHT_08895 [Puccinia striiformis]
MGVLPILGLPTPNDFLDPRLFVSSRPNLSTYTTLAIQLNSTYEEQDENGRMAFMLKIRLSYKRIPESSRDFGDEGNPSNRLDGIEECRCVSQAAAKAGPHGNLISPKSGKLIRSVGGLGTIAVKFVKYKGNDGETIAIDVRLRPISDDENRTTYVVVLNFFLFPCQNIPHFENKIC